MSAENECEFESGVWISGGRKSVLRPILKKWMSECRRYTEITGDASWWFNERASTGILAIAAAKTRGWAALEEYSTTKGQIDVNGVKKNIKGRCDLYISNDKYDFAIEFKQAWQNLFPTDRFSKVSNGWRDAWAQSRSVWKPLPEAVVIGRLLGWNNSSRKPWD